MQNHIKMHYTISETLTKKSSNKHLPQGQRSSSEDEYFVNFVEKVVQG